MPRKLEDLTKSEFGYLKVIEYAGLVQSGKQKQSAWRCACKCGNEVIVLNGNLKRQTRSCGCLQKEVSSKIKVDLTDKSFGILKVIRMECVKDGNSQWFCECKCGETCIISGCNLQDGQKSCGCLQGWWRSKKPGLWKNPAEYAKWRREDPIQKMRDSISSSIRSMLFSNGSYKRKKSIRNFLPYSIEELKIYLESLWEPWMNWENYGGRSDDERRTWHIDHIKPHSSFYYKSMIDKAFLECWSLANLRPMEKLANMAKGNRPA